ncbi:MAG: hypothetical protein NZ602_08095 [Thermoguttaceae bacterium]|nr:hypothetical protein [Thermoguttaceae bacterium]MDW8038789.1 hypothetical protein [Thermoguttaceae bacterium]
MLFGLAGLWLGGIVAEGSTPADQPTTSSSAFSSERASNGPEILGVQVGWAGRYKVGFWTPVEVLVRGGRQAGQAVVVLQTTDSEGTVACFGSRVGPERLLRWTGPDVLRLSMYALFTQTESGLTVALHEPVFEGEQFRAGRRLVEERIRISAGLGSGRTEAADESEEINSLKQMFPALWATQLLLVSIGPGSVGLEEAVRPVELIGSLHWPKARSPVVVAISQPEAVGRLPKDWFGYEGVDLITISTSQPELLQPLLNDPQRTEALTEWVRLGGKLVLFIGSQAKWLAEQGGVLGRLLPGRIVGTSTLRTAAGYEIYADSRVPVPGMGRPNTGIWVPRWEELEGQVEVRQADLPLAIRWPLGLGEVVVVGGDFDRPPLAQWPDRGRFLRKLLALPLPKGEEGREGGALMHTGYRDLSGQWRSALDQFPGLPMVSFWPVAGLILLYLLLIGPGDYLLLRKVVGRMHWTWLTFSTMVVLTSAGAYGLGLYLKGRQVRYNQVDLVDVDVKSGRVRGTTWINLFSPQTDTYTLSLSPYGPDGNPLDHPQMLLSPIGLAGEGLGGMRTRPGGTLLWERHYEWSARADQLLELPVHVWSSRVLLARWWAQSRTWPKAELIDRDQLPEGTLTNTLPISLEQCILAYGRWGYALGRLDPGQSVAIEPMSRLRIELPTLLSGGGGAQLGKAGWAAAGRKPYNPQSLHLTEILQTMMFFDTIGGEAYTGLCHRYHSFLDGSGWLRQGRAVLVAQIRPQPPSPTGASKNTPSPSHPGAILLRDGQPLEHPAEDQHLVFVRFVYPVVQSRP